MISDLVPTGGWIDEIISVGLVLDQVDLPWSVHTTHIRIARLVDEVRSIIILVNNIG